MLTWELAGAVIGAGLASGQEIASFFSQYGGWSYPGILLAVGTMISLCGTELPAAWEKRWQGYLWHALLTALLVATGAAMLGGGAEVGGLMLPVQGSYWIGMGMTLLLAYWLACRTAGGLAWVSRALLAVMGILLLLGFARTRMTAAAVNAGHPVQGALRAMAYGGFNAALQTPIMTGAAALPRRTRDSAARCAGLLIGLLLLMGNALLLYHPALLGTEMPFIHLVMQMGKAGYWIGSVCLYLAILSTLTACIKGTGGSWLCLMAMALISLMGFEGVVERVYPLLGGGCFLLLAAAKWSGSPRRTI